jgi:predicted nucleotidyltransferase
MTPATKQKREQLKEYIERVLVPDSAVKAVIGIGSIATGHMRSDSDIDAVVFLDPFDYYIVPAEAVWHPGNATYYSILNEEAREEGLPLNFVRLNWQEWRDPDFDWPEERRAELSMGWVAYDRSGQVTKLIAERTAYPRDLRLARLDEAIIWLDQHLSEDKVQQCWQHLEPAIAHDRLQVAHNYLVQALFAYNRAWRVWRHREMEALLTLPWLPQDFAGRVLTATNAPGLDVDGYMARAEMIRALFEELLDQLRQGGDYSNMPVDQAFIRSREEPGRAWNMEEWNKFYQARKM